MSAKADPSPVRSATQHSNLPTFRMSVHEHGDAQSASSKDANSFGGIPRDESSGLLSSIISVAHNAANMMKSKHGASTESLGQRSDTNESRTKKLHPSAFISSSQGSEISIDEPSSIRHPEPSQNSPLSPSNVHFEPIHSSPIHTMGEGDLSLVHFAKQEPVPKIFSDSAEVPVKGGPFMTETNSNKLLVSGSQDSKVVRRKSISNGSIAESMSSEGTIDTDGADSHTFDPSEFSNLELDQILDSSSKYRVHPKKDKEFHHTFKQIPRNEHLLADFSCALSRDILVHGKMYLSPHYICFNSNILGWVTNIVVPIPEIIQIEKKSTAVLFPNGMVIRTLHQKYVFATFLSRDSTFNMITQVWHNALQDNNPDEQGKQKKMQKRKSLSRRSTVNGSEISDDDSDDLVSGSDEDDASLQSSGNHDLTFASKSSEKSNLKELKKARSEVASSQSGSESDNEAASAYASNDSPSSSEKKGGKVFRGFRNPGPQSHAPTTFDHDKADGEAEILQHTFNAPLGVVYNMLYGPDNSTFIKVLEEGKNFDISKEKITELNSSRKEREYSYTKPLSGPIGPKQTKCNITETVYKYDLSSYCELEQVTRTPDVPSGNSFKVKTRFFFSWGPKNTTKLTVFTSVEWSAKSWIKSAVEKGSLDGQKSSMKTLTDTITDLIVNGGSGAAKKKRRRTKSDGQTAAKPAEQPSQPAPPPSLSGQILDILDHIGSSVPVQIPMISNTVTGGVVLFALSLLYSFILTFLLGGRSGSSSSSKAILANGGRYFLMPSSEVYLRDERFRSQSETQLWDWIAKRTGAESPDFVKGQHVSERLVDENVREMMRLTKKRIDAAYQGIM